MELRSQLSCRANGNSYIRTKGQSNLRSLLYTWKWQLLCFNHLHYVQCTFINDNVESFKINQGHKFKYHFSVVTTVILLPFVFTAYVYKIAFVRKKQWKNILVGLRSIISGSPLPKNHAIFQNWLCLRNFSDHSSQTFKWNTQKTTQLALMYYLRNNKHANNIKINWRIFLN